MKKIAVSVIIAILSFMMLLTAVPAYAQPGNGGSEGQTHYNCSSKDGTCRVVHSVDFTAKRHQDDYQQKLAVLEKKIMHAMDDLDKAMVSNGDGRIKQALQQQVEILEKEYWQLKIIE